MNEQSQMGTGPVQPYWETSQQAPQQGSQQHGRQDASGQMQMQGEVPSPMSPMAAMPPLPPLPPFSSQSQSQSQGDGAAQTQQQGAAAAGRPAPHTLRWLRVQHETRYFYGAPVELAHHVAHLSPRDTPFQQVRGWTLLIDPAPDEWIHVAPNLTHGGALRLEPGAAHTLPGQFSLDSWGNRRLAFSHARVHEQLRVCSSFEVGICAVDIGDPQSGPSWEAVAESLRYHAGAVHSEAVEFTLASFFAPHAPQLAAFGRDAFTPGRPLLAGALALMKQVHQRFEYKPNSTSVATRALEALALSKGVCQDFAHVMIGACRSLGLAARYISGYLLTHPPEGQPRLLGADASHAWVEIWCPPLGWVALDPTNDVPAGTDHVTLAWGRDYADVAPLRGVIRGGGRSQPNVAVTVEPLEENPA